MVYGVLGSRGRAPLPCIAHGTVQPEAQTNGLLLRRGKTACLNSLSVYLPLSLSPPLALSLSVSVPLSLSLYPLFLCFSCLSLATITTPPATRVRFPHHTPPPLADDVGDGQPTPPPSLGSGAAPGSGTGFSSSSLTSGSAATTGTRSPVTSTTSSEIAVPGVVPDEGGLICCVCVCRDHQVPRKLAGVVV